MRVAIFKGAGKPLSIESAPDPIPEPDQAVIRVSRCGICGSDFHMTSGGGYDVAVGSALGHEYAGEVVALGRDCTKLRSGDRVTALPFGGCGICTACASGDPFRCERLRILAGGFGEYTLIQERFSVRLSDALSFADGALIEPLASAHHGVHCADLRPCPRVLIIGTGGIGLATTFWARQLGAGRIVLTARHDTAAARALQQGASAFLTESNELASAAEDVLHGAPEVVFDCAGGEHTLARAIDLVAVGGTIVVLGASYAPVSLIPVRALHKAVRVVFSVAYKVRDFEAAVEVLAAGGTRHRSIISEEIGLGQLSSRFETLRGERGAGKVLVDPWA